MKHRNTDRNLRDNIRYNDDTTSTIYIQRKCRIEAQVWGLAHARPNYYTVIIVCLYMHNNNNTCVKQVHVSMVHHVNKVINLGLGIG